MRSKHSHEGYLLIDHRASPGAGVVPAGQTFESATYTCRHCHMVVVLNPNRSRERHWCSGCDHYICDVCAEIRQNTGLCRDLTRLMDQLQEDGLKQERGGVVLTDR